MGTNAEVDFQGREIRRLKQLYETSREKFEAYALLDPPPGTEDWKQLCVFLDEIESLKIPEFVTGSLYWELDGLKIAARNWKSTGIVQLL